MTWQWRDGTAWRDFDPGLAAQLDRARDAGQATCVYSFRGQPYEVDFQQNTQVNKNTGFARDVRRLGDLASPAVEGQVVSGQMGFLYDAREDLKAGLRTETGKKISTSAACSVCLLLFINLIICRFAARRLISPGDCAVNSGGARQIWPLRTARQAGP